MVEQMVKEVGRLARGSWLKTALVDSELRRFWSWPRTLVVFFRPVLSFTTEEAFTAESELIMQNKKTVADILQFIFSNVFRILW